MSSYCKFYKEKKQVSYDNGITWSDVVPAEYRKGELIQSGSTDCESGPTGYSTQYLTFVVVSAGTFSFEGSSSSTINNSSIQYSLNDGATWFTLNRGIQSSYIEAGRKIMWKSSSLRPVGWDDLGINGIGSFYSTGKFNIEGNIMSLLFGDDFRGKTSLTGYDYAFLGLFGSPANTNIMNIDNLVLPATTLSLGCYMYLFAGCSQLTTVPSDLLPSTTLADSCYLSMFDGCSSLTTAPVLNALSLPTYSYEGMFANCPSLNYVKCLATDISAAACTAQWLDGVASSGTFVKNSSMNSWTTGINGIPSNWSVQNA